MKILSNKKAFSLTELMITSVLLIVLFATALTGFILTKNIFAVDIAKATFQRDAEVVMNKMIEGKGDPSGIRLSETASVTFYSDAGKLTFIGTDGIPRTYSLTNNGTSLQYSEQNGLQKIMYTAPQGALIGLTFSPVDLNPTLCVCIYVSISQVINGKTVLGSLESSIYLRNHSV